jgi:ribose-phosphate pyrophosphokinase
MATGFGELSSRAPHPGSRADAGVLGVGMGQARLRRFPIRKSRSRSTRTSAAPTSSVMTSNPVDQHLVERVDAAVVGGADHGGAAHWLRVRIAGKPRVPISAKLVANVLSAAGTNRVLTMDLHKRRFRGSLTFRSTVRRAGDHRLPARLDIRVTMVSPDAGGAERAVREAAGRRARSSTSAAATTALPR